MQAIFIAFDSGGNLGIRIIFLTFWNSDFDSEILFKNIFLDFCAILSNSGCFCTFFLHKYNDDSWHFLFRDSNFLSMGSVELKDMN